MIALVVLSGIIHSLNGQSLSVLRDLGVYLKTSNAESFVVTSFLPAYLIKEGVSPCLLSSFLRCCLGTSSFSA